jgi:hypothetical protein
MGEFRNLILGKSVTCFWALLLKALGNNQNQNLG